MTKKLKKVHDRNPLFDAGRRVALASVGAVALASDEFKNLVNKLIERGEIVETDGRKRYEEMTVRCRREQMNRAQISTVRRQRRECPRRRAG